MPPAYTPETLNHSLPETLRMTIKSFTFNPFQTNCYVCHDGNRAVLIDPSSHTPEERALVLDYIDRHSLSVESLLLTHAHIDHVMDCAFFAGHFGQSFQLYASDVPLLLRAQDQGRMFGVEVEPPPAPGRLLAEGAVLTVGSSSWQVLHTPGHSPGSICFYDEKNRFVIAGDVLFQGSIGRTDLWQGSLPQLMASIYDKLLPLGDDVTVYPGHGPATTIGAERAANPFLTWPRQIKAPPGGRPSASR